MGWTDTPGDASGLAIVGNYAFVADGPEGLQVIDIQNPYSPKKVASAATGSASYALDHAFDYAFVADRISGIQVVDIRDPEFPDIFPSAGTDGEANWVLFAGDLSYVADGSSGLRIIDTSCYSYTSGSKSAGNVH